MEKHNLLEGCGRSAESGRKGCMNFYRSLIRKIVYHGKEGAPIYVPETEANKLEKMDIEPGKSVAISPYRKNDITREKTGYVYEKTVWRPHVLGSISSR